MASVFAEKLTPEEVKEMKMKDEFVTERILSAFVHNSYSPKFLGLQQGLRLWKLCSIWSYQSHQIRIVTKI